MRQPAKLALEDGTVYAGYSFGAEGEVDGEVCFNTSMTGYQEILTDPSYCGQIVTMTYPEIGNYGVNSQDVESRRPFLSGFIVREYSRRASNFRCEEDLQEFLTRAGIVALEGIDTRALVRRIRDRGALRGIVSTQDLDDASLVTKAQASPGLIGRDLVREVVADGPREWTQGLHPLSEFHAASAAETANTSKQASSKASAAGNPQTNGAPAANTTSADASSRPHVVAMDYGIKWNIPRHLHQMGCRVTVAPGTISGEEIMALKPDGVFLSNGPGDPEPLQYAISAVRHVLGKKPVFGICLGHQLLSMACGAKTFKLKFGHRGANQPVMDHLTGKVEITSQNHGFAVDTDGLPSELEVTHTNLNDDTIEGVRHRELSAFSVQYHPEASAGPHDSSYLFGRFMDAMRSA